MVRINQSPGGLTRNNSPVVRRNLQQKKENNHFKARVESETSLVFAFENDSRNRLRDVAGDSLVVTDVATQEILLK